MISYSFIAVSVQPEAAFYFQELSSERLNTGNKKETVSNVIGNIEISNLLEDFIRYLSCRIMSKIIINYSHFSKTENSMLIQIVFSKVGSMMDFI